MLTRQDQRAEYFIPLITHLQTPPNMWPDAMPRRPRSVEVLPLAKPLPPRKPTDAEIARERERDLNARNMMVLSFTGLVGEFARKYKRVVASVKVSAAGATGMRFSRRRYPLIEVIGRRLPPSFSTGPTCQGG